MVFSFQCWKCYLKHFPLLQISLILPLLKFVAGDTSLILLYLLRDIEFSTSPDNEEKRDNESKVELEKFRFILVRLVLLKLYFSFFFLYFFFGL